MTIPRLLILTQNFTGCPRLNLEGPKGKAYPFEWCKERGQYEYQPKNKEEMLDLCMSTAYNLTYFFMPVIQYDSPESMREWVGKCRDVGVEVRDTDTVEILQRLYAVAIKPPVATVTVPPPVHPAAITVEDDEEIEVPPSLNRRARRQSKFSEQPALANATG